MYRYPDGSTDKTMVQLNFWDVEEEEPFGVLNWFAVHPTSMNNTNHLISGRVFAIKNVEIITTHFNLFKAHRLGSIKFYLAAFNH